MKLLEELMPKHENVIMKKTIIILLTVSCAVFSQNENIYPVTINEKFPDFILNTHDGGQLSLADLKGNKAMLIFIRGRVTNEVWCPICHYQYLEMVQMEKSEDLREKYNLEIFFIMPYSSDTLDHWISAIPTSLNTIEGWKHPVNPDGVTDNQKEWAQYCLKFFPFSFEFSTEKFELTLPILFDEDHSVSEGLNLFRNEWGGTTVEQNVPAIFILDEAGFVKFKYFSQYTNDRVDAKYLMKYLKQML